MSGSYRCHGKPGTNEILCAYYEDDFPPPEGTVAMIGMPPTNRPTRFGDWFATPEGAYAWNVFPDPPFNVVYHEGKLKNADTMEEISIEMLPGDISARLMALENPTP
ncbi:hypothetical protein [Pseudomonas sp. GV047]|uniref:hypothetical protein n=1 Tax=Pseudomonas sp. GV047 TaxID=2135751 RepID=UPI00105B4886|nr:hypothetical protein [Pseudomonas sp. GV047]